MRKFSHLLNKQSFFTHIHTNWGSGEEKARTKLEISEITGLFGK